MICPLQTEEYLEPNELHGPVKIIFVLLRKVNVYNFIRRMKVKVYNLVRHTWLIVFFFFYWPSGGVHPPLATTNAYRLVHCDQEKCTVEITWMVINSRKRLVFHRSPEKVIGLKNLGKWQISVSVKVWALLKSSHRTFIGQICLKRFHLPFSFLGFPHNILLWK